MNKYSSMNVAARLIDVDGTGVIFGDVLQFINDRALSSTGRKVCKAWTQVIATTQHRTFQVLPIGTSCWLESVEKQSIHALKCGSARAKLR